MKNFVCISSKYYKTSNHSSLVSHNLRDPNMYHENVIDPDIRKKSNKYFKNYDKTLKDFDTVLDTVKQIQIKNRSYHKKSANTYYQHVLALSEAQYLSDMRNGKEQNIRNAIESYIKQIENTFGFIGLEYSIHNDEGYVNDDKFILNAHVHIGFFNFDMKKERSVLRDLRKADWENMQDLAAEAFIENGLNYKRGVSKHKTKQKHLQKDLYIQNKQKQQEEQIISILGLYENIDKLSFEDEAKYKEQYKNNKLVKRALTYAYRIKRKEVELSKLNSKSDELQTLVKSLEQDEKRLRKTISKYSKLDNNLDELAVLTTSMTEDSVNQLGGLK